MSQILIGILCGFGPILIVLIIIFFDNRKRKKREKFNHLADLHGGLIPPRELEQYIKLKKI